MLYTALVYSVSLYVREVSGDEVKDNRDLKASITHREKQGSRADSYINYRIVTEVDTVVYTLPYVKVLQLEQHMASTTLTEAHKTSAV